MHHRLPSLLPCTLARTLASPLPALLLAVLLAALPVPVRAETLSAAFDVRIGALRLGALEMRGAETSGRYEVQGAAQSTGLVGEFARWSVSAAAAGAVSDTRYSPSRFTSERRDRKGTTRTTFRYAAGTPQVTQTPADDNRKPWHAGPEDQRGTVDPLTAVWALLRDRPKAGACDLDLSSYDGRTRARLRLGGLRAEDGRLVCPGTYTRIDGYSDEEMKEQVRWSFSLIYDDTNGPLLRTRALHLPTRYGLIRVIRK